MHPFRLITDLLSRLLAHPLLAAGLLFFAWIASVWAGISSTFGLFLLLLLPLAYYARPRSLPRRAQAILVGLAVVALGFGLDVLQSHIFFDPLTDIHAYYDAASRLNAGLPLYPSGAIDSAADFYRYPPLLAIAFRPLALLPFSTAALIWETVVGATFLLFVRRLLGRVGRINTALALALLSGPLIWALIIGQAQIPVTLLLGIGAPWAIALAGHLKIFPLLVVLFWVGRREWKVVAQIIAWTAGLTALSFVLEPRGSFEFLSYLSRSANVSAEIINLSPFVLSPIVWAIWAAALVLAVIFSARTRHGWFLAVAASVMISPRLLSYMFASLPAGLITPGPIDSPPDHKEAP